MALSEREIKYYKRKFEKFEDLVIRARDRVMNSSTIDEEEKVHVNRLAKELLVVYKNKILAPEIFDLIEEHYQLLTKIDPDGNNNI